MKRRYSRRSKIEKSRNIKKAIIFTVLTIALIFLTIILGIPLLAKYTAFVSDIKQDSQPVENDDATPPPPPSVNSIPEATNEQELEVSGKTEPGSTVVIDGGGKIKEILANKEGDFSTTLRLKSGNNNIQFQSIDTSGNESKTTVINVIFDDQPPDLTITQPKDGSSFYGSRQRQVTIEGTTEKNTKVTINERVVIVDSDGSFSYFITLSEGKNDFVIVASDNAENKTEQVLTLNYAN